MADKLKILAYCDAPTCATGFGTVSRNIFEGIQRSGKYDIDILGINYWGDPHEFPYRIWPTGTNNERDPYGRQKVFNMIPGMDFDILFFLQDTFIMNFIPKLLPQLKLNRAKPFKSIVYYPIDSIIKQEWVNNIKDIDYKVAYCQFGVDQTLETDPNIGDIRWIPHGVNTLEYYPIEDERMQNFKKQYFGKKADHFIITNLNRNQQRKDIPRLMLAYKKFKKLVPNSLLYLHMAMKDQGWNLPEVAKLMGFKDDEIVFPQNFGPNQGYPREVVNLLYNCSDVVVSTTLGEGFGLSWIEAMAARVPIIMPDNTAMAEFITKDMGYLANSGSDTSLHTVLPNDNEVVRLLTDLDDMVDKLLHVYNNKEEAKQKAANAYKWVTESMDWQKHIAPQWVDMFDEAADNIGKDSKVSFDENEMLDAEVF